MSPLNKYVGFTISLDPSGAILSASPIPPTGE